jgi:hypothetical protein
MMPTFVILPGYIMMSQMSSMYHAMLVSPLTVIYMILSTLLATLLNLISLMVELSARLFASSMQTIGTVVVCVLPSLASFNSHLLFCV